MYVFNDAATTARIRRSRNRTNPEIVETNALQQKNASELAELDRQTTQLKAEYDDLHDRYKRVCEYYNLPIVKLEDRCSKCLCSLQDTIDNNPLPFDDQELGAGLRRKKTKRKRTNRISRTNRLSRIIRRKTKIRKYSKKRH